MRGRGSEAQNIPQAASPHRPARAAASVTSESDEVAVRERTGEEGGTAVRHERGAKMSEERNEKQ